MRVSEIRVKRIRVNQGLGVYCLFFFAAPQNIVTAHHTWKLYLSAVPEKSPTESVLLCTVPASSQTAAGTKLWRDVWLMW